MNKLGFILENFTQYHNRRKQVRKFYMNQDGYENKNCASTQFSQI